MTPREQPIGRLRILGVATAVLLLVLLAGAGIEQLRHTDEVGEPFAVDLDAGDPRNGIECPEPPPREGQPRDEDVQPQVQPPLERGSGDLLSCPQTYDGRRVVFRGEAVGQVLGRGDRLWLQVNDDLYAGDIGPLPAHRYYRGGNSGIGVSLPREEVDKLTWRGGPAAHGDQVEVHGVFHRVDPASAEMAVIAGERLVVLAEGRPLEQQGHTDRRVVAYVLSAIALGMVVVQRRRARA